MLERAARIQRHPETETTDTRDTDKVDGKDAGKVSPDSATTESVQRRAVQPAPIAIGDTIAQAKLSVGPAGDAFEREADAVAARVVRSIRTAETTATVGENESEPRAQRSRPDNGPDTGGDGSNDDGDGESVDVGGRLRRIQRAAMTTAPIASSITSINRIQRAATVGAAGGELDADTERMLKSSRSGGRPLPDPARTKMETAFGADFSGIRVHSGSTSTELNDRIQAKAFTAGNDIYFRDNVPDTSSTSGQELLAHELTHTIQ